MFWLRRFKYERMRKVEIRRTNILGVIVILPAQYFGFGGEFLYWAYVFSIYDYNRCASILHSLFGTQSSGTGYNGYMSAVLVSKSQYCRVMVHRSSGQHKPQPNDKQHPNDPSVIRTPQARNTLDGTLQAETTVTAPPTTVSSASSGNSIAMLYS